MGNTWDRAKELSEKCAAANGIFVRLAADEDSVIGVFCGAPYAREAFWTGNGYVPYDENDPDHKGKGPALRVTINFYIVTDGVMKIIEGGTQWFNSVLKVREKYGLDKWAFEIQRHGEGTKTKYSILPDSQVDSALRAKIAKVELYDLEQVVGNADREDSTTEKTNPLIDPATATNVIERLKQIPRSAIDDLLKSFGVQRVKDIKSGDVAKLKAAIAKLESGADDGEIDPFA